MIKHQFHHSSIGPKVLGWLRTWFRPGNMIMHHFHHSSTGPKVLGWLRTWFRPGSMIMQQFDHSTAGSKDGLLARGGISLCSLAECRWVWLRSPPEANGTQLKYSFCCLALPSSTATDAVDAIEGKAMRAELVC